MLVDSSSVVTVDQFIVENVTVLPASAGADDLVYLTQVDGANVQGLYIYIDSTWTLFSEPQ